MSRCLTALPRREGTRAGLEFTDHAVVAGEFPIDQRDGDHPGAVDLVEHARLTQVEVLLPRSGSHSSMDVAMPSVRLIQPW